MSTGTVTVERSPGGLVGRKTLVVDEDVRNILARTSVLEKEQVSP